METNPDPEIKRIIIVDKKQNKNENEKRTKKVATTTKEKKDRVVTQTKTWNTHFQEYDYNIDKQLELVRELQLDVDIDKNIDKNKNNTTQKNRFLLSQIKGKIQGYKTQDIQKNKLDVGKLIDLPYVLNKLIDCGLLCYYCKEPMLVWYKHTRDPKQWSLDRIDNDYGHNKGNVEISCLSCNIKRRCMYHDRFRFTKQLILTKVDHNHNHNHNHTT